MKTANQIISDVLAAMQPAEEIGGPEGPEYLKLMQAIAAEATKRAKTFLANHTSRVSARAMVTIRNGRAAYLITDGPHRGATFFADDVQPVGTVLDDKAIVVFNPDDQFARRASWPIDGEP